MTRRLKEFGFNHIERFPKNIIDHALTIGLPTASAHVTPVTVIINRGLIVPVQMSKSFNGSIIKDDGTMVHVSHEDQLDISSPLQISYIKDIPYDIRVEVYNIMRRAIQADPQLIPIWTDILSQWTLRFPSQVNEIQYQEAGTFANVQLAFMGLKKLIQQYLDQSPKYLGQSHEMPLKIITQTMEGFGLGWQGEEFLVDKTSVFQIQSMGLMQYLQQDLGPKLRAILKGPLFHSLSTFKLYYESNRAMPVINLIVVAQAQNLSVEDFLRGIDLNPQLLL